MDALSNLLQTLLPRGHVFFTGDYCGNFAVDTSGDGRAHFHVIARGTCWLKLPDREDVQALHGGDLVLFPRDARHLLMPRPEERTTPGDTDGFVSLICGHYEFETRRTNPILDALPEAIVLRAEDQPEDGWLDTLLQFMRHESQRSAPGSGAVIDRLAEVLFLYILRALMADPARTPGFLRALADPGLARALGAMHEHPERAWSLAGLAETAGMSRTLFANRFQDLVQVTPMAYLARHRMELARRWLQAGQLSMAEIAERSGYASEAAFGKAYKKITGESPGETKKRAASQKS